jgi:hypothetical protein
VSTVDYRSADVRKAGGLLSTERQLQKITLTTFLNDITEAPGNVFVIVL